MSIAHAATGRPSTDQSASFWKPPGAATAARVWARLSASPRAASRGARVTREGGRPGGGGDEGRQLELGEEEAVEYADRSADGDTRHEAGQQPVLADLDGHD